MYKLTSSNPYSRVNGNDKICKSVVTWGERTVIIKGHEDTWGVDISMISIVVTLLKYILKSNVLIVYFKYEHLCMSVIPQ